MKVTIPVICAQVVHMHGAVWGVYSDLLFCVLLQLHDILAVKVNDPAGFSAHFKPEKAAALIPIQPIPLQSYAKIAECLNGDVRLLVAHFPWQKDHMAKCLELSFGLKLKVNVWQGKPILQLLH